jgi:hypothetical protein
VWLEELKSEAKKEGGHGSSSTALVKPGIQILIPLLLKKGDIAKRASQERRHQYKSKFLVP